MGLYFPKLHEPINCGDCSERDPEYGGACGLMPGSNFETFDDQFACCPIISLIKGNTCYHTKPGDILIRGTVYKEKKCS